MGTVTVRMSCERERVLWYSDRMSCERESAVGTVTVRMSCERERQRVLWVQ